MAANGLHKSCSTPSTLSALLSAMYPLQYIYPLSSLPYILCNICTAIYPPLSALQYILLLGLPLAEYNQGTNCTLHTSLLQTAYCTHCQPSLLCNISLYWTTYLAIILWICTSVSYNNTVRAHHIKHKCKV